MPTNKPFLQDSFEFLLRVPVLICATAGGMVLDCDLPNCKGMMDCTYLARDRLTETMQAGQGLIHETPCKETRHALVPPLAPKSSDCTREPTPQSLVNMV